MKKKGGKGLGRKKEVVVTGTKNGKPVATETWEKPLLGKWRVTSKTENGKTTKNPYGKKRTYVGKLIGKMKK